VINEKAIHGEKNTGYEGPEGGAFRCSNCTYFNATSDSCGQEDMMKYSKREKLPSGRVEVDAGGCCEYIERKE
jgi:hypothetical protein